ncbi:MAG TPA: GNAT family N-acyltransferase [Immundisolibacter sp.]
MINPFSSHQPGVVVALADTAKSLRLHRRLRYQVYCQQLGYEDPTRFPDGEEWDHYDEHSVQFVAYDGRRRDWAGTLRLIRPGPAGLPLTSLTGLKSSVIHLMKQQRVAEISRMCVTPEPPPAADEERRTPDSAPTRESALIFFALIRASVAYAFGHGFDHLAFLTTRSLSRLLGRVGVADQPAGDGCHHRGLRYPRIADVAQLYRDLIEAPEGHPFTARLARLPYVPFSALPAQAVTDESCMA